MFRIKYRYLFILLLALYSYFNILFTEGDRLISTHHISPAVLFATISAIVVLIWEGNRVIEKRLRAGKWPFRGRLHPLIIFFALSLVVVCVVSLVTIIAGIILTNNQLPDIITEAKLVLGFAFRINLFLNCLHAIVYYMNELKKSQLQAEKLEKATSEAQFQSLRSQINPHFLFNNFNTLSSLVYKDPEVASAFIQQLSKVYRYLLYHQEGETVPLSQELEFIDSYLYLLHIRFGDNLVIDNRIPKDTDQSYIAPVALQMLIENAIKHNVVSAKYPLTIRLYLQGQPASHLVVENSYHPREEAPDSTYTGLSNIKQRYRFISNKEVEVQHDTESFCVKLPLLSDTI